MQGEYSNSEGSVFVGMIKGRNDMILRVKYIGRLDEHPIRSAPRGEDLLVEKGYAQEFFNPEEKYKTQYSEIRLNLAYAAPAPPYSNLGKDDWMRIFAAIRALKLEHKPHIGEGSHLFADVKLLSLYQKPETGAIYTLTYRLGTIGTYGMRPRYYNKNPAERSLNPKNEGFFALSEGAGSDMDAASAAISAAGGYRYSYAVLSSREHELGSILGNAAQGVFHKIKD